MDTLSERKNLRVKAVPFVDVDGVEEGDQGKIESRMITTEIMVLLLCIPRFERSSGFCESRPIHALFWPWIYIAHGFAM